MSRSSRHQPRAALGAPLTSREAQILALVAAGEPTPAIGHRLGITQNTVKSHLVNIYDKTGSRNRVDAVRYYLQHHTIADQGEQGAMAASARPRRGRGETSLLQRQIDEIDARIKQLKPAADELERLQRARDALRAADSDRYQHTGGSDQ